MLFFREMATRLLDTFDQELAARSLAAVGVKGNKLYLAAVADSLPDDFATNRELTGVAGVSATRDIWKQFSQTPDAVYCLSCLPTQLCGRTVWFV